MLYRPARRPHGRYSERIPLTDEQQQEVNLRGSGRLRDLREAAAHGWLSGTVGGLLALAAIALTLFVIRSLRGSAPLVNLRVFANPVFVQGMLFVLLIQFCVLALGYLIPLRTRQKNKTR